MSHITIRSLFITLDQQAAARRNGERDRITRWKFGESSDTSSTTTDDTKFVMRTSSSSGQRLWQESDISASVTVTSKDLKTSQSNVSTTTTMSAETTTEMITMKMTMMDTSEEVTTQENARQINAVRECTDVEKTVITTFWWDVKMKPSRSLISRATEYSTHVMTGTFWTRSSWSWPTR